MTVEPNRGGQGNCLACNHPAVLIINEFLTNKKVVLDGQTFDSSVKLGDYLLKKYPQFSHVKPHNFTRHKQHVSGFDQGTAMILRGNRLFRPGKDGELEEIRQFEPEIALRIIISIGLDALVSQRIKIGAKTLVDALKIYADITKDREDPDAYDTIIAERHKGHVIDVTPVDTNSILDGVSPTQIPADLIPPVEEEDEDEE